MTFPVASVRQPRPSSQEGFALIGLVVVIFIILLMLSIAAPTVAKQLRREREVETVQRAKQYIRAIQLYSKKAGGYPGTLEQLEKANNIRYLRQRYADPMTGKPDWRLIKVGENKTTVKGFFGQPLAGLQTTGIGANGTSSNPGTGSPQMGLNTLGSNPSSTTGTSDPTTAPGTSPTASTGGDSGASGVSPTTSGGLGSTSPSTGVGSQSASGFSGSGAPFLGVGLPVPGSASIVVNEKTTYPEWEFLYDPRIEALKAKVNIFGGGMTSSGASSLGSNSSPIGGTPAPTPATPPATPTQSPPASPPSPGASTSP